MLEALLLGVIEGLTEFLPISSTGHLLIVEHWLGRRSDLFNVAIQAGAIAAVALVYRNRLVELARGYRHDASRDYLLKVLVAFGVTAVLGLAAKLAGAELPETVDPIAIALIAGGVVIVIAERYLKHARVDERITWRVAIAVGLAQVVAGVFPGTSRSAAALIAAVLAGLTVRRSAAEFAFIVGLPTMLAATGYEVLKTLASDAPVPAADWAELAAAFATATVTGFATVRWLLGFLTRHGLGVFAVYRIALGAALLIWLD